MREQFENLSPADKELFFCESDADDARLGGIVSKIDYENADIIILGGGGTTDKKNDEIYAVNAIREQFYKLTPFGIHKKICDLGNTKPGQTPEETYGAYSEVVAKILNDGKKIIVLGGGGVSYSDGRAMAAVFGARDWIAINVDARLDVRADAVRENENSFRRLLEEKFLRPDYFYEAAFQPHFASPVYFRYLQNLGVNLISLDQLRSRETSDLELRELMRQKFINHSQSLGTFFCFDLAAVRSSEAPGVTASSPIGLRAGEFLNLVTFAAKLVNTKIIEFTEVNPKFDINNRTTKLVAIAMHRFCSSI